VQAQAAQHRPAAGDQNEYTVQTAQSEKTRSEVRAELRQALNSGYRVPSGSHSY
jgi:predicted secreted protein